MFLSYVDDDYLLLYPAHPGGIHRMAGPKTETPHVNRFAQNQGYEGDSSDDESQNSDGDSGDEIYSEELVSDDDEGSSAEGSDAGDSSSD